MISNLKLPQENFAQRDRGDIYKAYKPTTKIVVVLPIFLNGPICR